MRNYTVRALNHGIHDFFLANDEVNRHRHKYQHQLANLLKQPAANLLKLAASVIKCIPLLVMVWIGLCMWENPGSQAQFWGTALVCTITIPIAWTKFSLLKKEKVEETGSA